MKKDSVHDLALDTVASHILVLRGHRVMLDTDLAALYGVPIKRLNEQVRRNRTRFPVDFVFQLTEAEWTHLRSQLATLETGRGMHRKYRPYAFTEHGAVMLASVLNSAQAVEMSIFVVRAFIAQRRVLAAHKELAGKLRQLERRLDFTDESVAELYATIQKLFNPIDEEPPKIGFGTD